jgi:hypothetical protein
MAAEKEPSPAGYVSHYTAVLHTACEARRLIAGSKEAPVYCDPETIKAVEEAIKAISGAIVLQTELAKARSAS